MRFSILIPAVAVLGLAGCQVPAPTTAGAPVQVAAPEAAPAATPAPVLTPAPPTAPAVAEVEVETAQIEESGAGRARTDGRPDERVHGTGRDGST